MPDHPRQRNADIAALLAASARRDQSAFKQLYDATSGKLFAVALAILRRREAAEDVLQEAYIRIWNHAGRYDPTRASPMAWMATIVRNLAIDVRRNRRQPSSHDEDELLNLPDLSPNALDLIELSDDCQRTLAALNALDPMKRRLVIAAYVNGESRDELARRLGAPVGTVKSWLRRALIELRANMAGREGARRRIAA
jgi:RNA polymerase sigma-70 factor (ECF subfamily)